MGGTIRGETPLPQKSKTKKEIAMGIQPQGDHLRNAVKWISEQKIENPEVSLQSLIEKAGARFNLSPKDEIFLSRAENYKD